MWIRPKTFACSRWLAHSQLGDTSSARAAALDAPEWTAESDEDFDVGVTAGIGWSLGEFVRHHYQRSSAHDALPMDL